MKTVLVREADKEYYNDMLPAELMFLLGDPDMILLGVVDETEKGAVPAALMILSAASEKQPVLEWLYVKEEYRGRGIGEDLMLQAFELAKQGGTGVLYAKLRLTKESPKKGKKDRDGFSAELYGQRDWLDSFGFYWDESQDNEWMFFVADMIDAKPEIFDKKYSNIKSFGALSKTIRGKFIKRIAEAYGSEISEAIDPDVSCVLHYGDDILSVLLVLNTDDTYTPIFFRSVDKSLDGIEELAAFAANAAIEKSDEIAILHMVWKDKEKMQKVKEVLGDVPPVETMLMVADADAPERLMKDYEEDRETLKKVEELVAQIPTKFRVVDVEYMSGVVLDDMP